MIVIVISRKKDKTFKPKKNIPEGTKQYHLKKYAEATLGSGNLRLAVTLPEGEDLNEWLAVNSNSQSFALILILIWILNFYYFFEFFIFIFFEFFFFLILILLSSSFSQCDLLMMAIEFDYNLKFILIWIDF